MLSNNSNIYKQNVEYPTFSKASDEEKKIFSDVFRFYEQYKNTSVILKTADRGAKCYHETVDKYMLDMKDDIDRICERGELAQRLVDAVLDYLDKPLVEKTRELAGRKETEKHG